MLKLEGAVVQLKSNTEIDWALGEVLLSIQTLVVHFGNGAQPIQVAVAKAANQPSRGEHFRGEVACLDGGF